MLLFKPEYVDLILSGKKTETRRTWEKRRAVPGAIHQCRTSYGAPIFARVHILEVYQQSVFEMTDRDAQRDGFDDLNAFIAKTGYTPFQFLWVVRFELVDEED